MPALAILTLILQIGCVVHVIRSGREYTWIFLIVMVPLIGSVVYLITQVLPELRASNRARQAGAGLLKAVDPGRELRRLKDQLALSDNVDNRLALADEYHRSGRLEGATEMYHACLSGPYAEDPYILLKLAQVQLDNEDAAATRRTLERLTAANPDFQSSDGHLLYARALEKLGETDQALEEYATLSTAYPGEEARVRYALLLMSLGQRNEAEAQFAQAIMRARRAPRYYRRKEKHWIDLAKAAGSH